MTPAVRKHITEDPKISSLNPENAVNRLNEASSDLDMDADRLLALSMMIGSSLDELGGCPIGGKVHHGVELLLQDIAKRMSLYAAEVNTVANLDTLKSMVARNA